MWKWIKIPKGIALAAFLLPWMTVSCQNQPLAKASGIGLAFGSIETIGPPQAEGAHLNIWLILALVTIATGLYFAVKGDAKAAPLTLATSLAALALIWLGTRSYSLSALADEAAKRRGGDPSAMLAMIRIDWHLGFYLAMMALLAAAALSWIVLNGREQEVSTKVSKLAGEAHAAFDRIVTPAMQADAVACPKCGKRLSSATKFCPDDGTAIEHST